MKSAVCSIGPFILGTLTAFNIPRKALSQRCGVDLPTLSKIFNGRMPLTDRKVFSLGVAIGELRATLKPAH